jgi:hypothetical protein
MTEGYRPTDQQVDAQPTKEQTGLQYDLALLRWVHEKWQAWKPAVAQVITGGVEVG